MRGKQRLLRTRRSRTTLANDLQRQVQRPDGETPSRPALAAQANRAEATAKSHTIKASGQAIRQIECAMRLQVRLSELHDSVATSLTSELTRAQVAAVNEFSLASTRIGHLSPWLPAVAVKLLMIVMLANDPAFIVAVLRHAMDLPDSVGVWRLDNPAVLVSTLSGIATSVILLSGATAGGKAIARLIFFDQVEKINTRHPELMRTARLVSKPRAAVIAVLAILPLAFSTVVLHGFAERRFRASDNPFGALTGGIDSAVAANLVLLIAFLPTIVLLLEIIAAVPAFEHARRTHRSAITLRWRQAGSIRQESRLARRYRRQHGRARMAFDWLRDIIDQVGLAADAEYVEAAIATALIEVPEKALRVTAHTGGAPSSRHLGDLPVVSHRVASVYRAWEALQEPAEHLALEAAWRGLRQDPHGFVPSFISGNAVGQPPSGPHLSRSQSHLHVGDDTAALPAA